VGQEISPHHIAAKTKEEETMSRSASVDRATIADLVIAGLRDVIAQSDTPPTAEITEATTLIGRNAVLDSLGIVSLIVDLEQQIEERFGATLSLANDRAMSQKNSPFRSVQTLTDYIVSLLAEEGGQG
jgi:acyl carrier protein